MYNVTGLFPIPVYSTTINIPESVNIFVNNLEYRDNAVNKYSVLSNILNCDELKEIKKQINEHLNNYCEEILCAEAGVRLNITQSWANITSINEHHHKHNHPNSIISGVLYLSPDIPSSIIFIKETNSIFHINTTKFNSYNSTQFSVSTHKGILLLFPSTLTHQVEKNKHVENRVSISFNTFYKGIIGDEKSLSLLEIK
jgi:uncharacterized protein (TIGR02466 family)